MPAPSFAPVFDSVEQMLDPAQLAALLDEDVRSVERQALDAPHFSGSTLERVQVRRSDSERRLVLKHFHPERDWVMRLTHDTQVRETALFRGEVYRRLPPQCRVPIIAVARAGDSWTSLMLDVTEALAPAEGVLAEGDARRFITHLAVFHACFVENRFLLHPSLGLTSLDDFVRILARPVVRRELEAGRAHPVLEMAARGWDRLEAAAPEAARLIFRLHDDARPLLSVLSRLPRTLLHGDYKLANLGALGPQTIMLDWQDAAFGPPLLDLAYFLMISAARLPFSKDEALDMYRAALAAQGHPYAEAVWERDCDLALLAGGALRVLWQKALAAESDVDAAQELAWWSERGLRARRWLR
jgi:aminoglycoside phosphotransferase (APT) family kinase protein